MRRDRLLIVAVFLVLVVAFGEGVNGLKLCGSSENFWDTTTCRDDQICCGSSCCDNPFTTFDNIRFPSTTTDQKISTTTSSSQMDFSGVLVLLGIIFFIICCPVCCYRCCCRKTTNRGRVYNPSGNVPVTVTLPPQQAAMQVPYPTVVPNPQQTPYPPQIPFNPYYNMPPPSYTQTMEAGTQQQQSPSAPPLMTM